MRTNGMIFASIASELSLSINSVKSFCSRFCQQLHWREHPELMNHTAIILKRCPACGKVFSDYQGHSRKYCSHACYIEYR